MSDDREPTFNPEASVEVDAMYGAETRRGLVALRVTDGDGAAITTLHTPAKAREVATFLLEAASAAEGDEAVASVLADAGFDLPAIGAVLVEVRQKRALLDQRARQEARRAVAFDQYDPDDPTS